MSSHPLHSGLRSVPVCGDVLRSLRLQRGFTQEELAQRSGYSSRLVQKAESNGSLSCSTIEDLAEALSTPKQAICSHDLMFSKEMIVGQYVEAYKTHEREFIATIAHWFAADFVAVIAGDPEQIPFAGTWPGVEGYTQFWAIFFDVFSRPDKNRYQPTLTVDNACCIAMGWESAQIVATGEITESWVTLRFEFENGLIKRVEHYFDTANTEKQLAGQRKPKE